MSRNRLTLLLLLMLSGFSAAPVAAAAPRTPAPKSAPAPAEAAPNAGTPSEDPAAAEDDATAQDDAGPGGNGSPPPAIDGGKSTAADPNASTSGPVSADVQGLQRDYEQLRDDLFKARARVSTVGSKLFHSKISLEVRSNLERFYEITNVTITVDGAPVVFLERGLGPPRTPLFQVFAAPGSHEIGISADLVARRDRTYKVTVHQTFGIVVPDASTVFTRLVMRETGNMWRFAKTRRGRYSMRIDLRARAKTDRKAKSKGSSGKKRTP